jgi:hypothetical protein
MHAHRFAFVELRTSEEAQRAVAGLDGIEVCIIRVSVHEFLRVNVQIFVCACIYIYMCVCVYVYVYEGISAESRRWP